MLQSPMNECQIKVFFFEWVKFLVGGPGPGPGSQRSITVPKFLQYYIYTTFTVRCAKIQPTAAIFFRFSLS